MYQTMYQEGEGGIMIHSMFHEYSLLLNSTDQL